ncbi:MAG: Calx-beta domain-containing protein [Methylococcales bacterium]|nr:Calx-beta domain-containing protein [Methylococcales bacterium]
MAKLFLESTDTSYKVSNSNTTVYGATGDQAVVIDGALTGVTINSNVERVQFTGSTTDYTYKVVGTNLEVYTAAGALVTTVGVQTDTTGTQLTFANGTVDAKITGLNAATVGGQTVSATAATAVTIPATAIDTTLASAPAPVFSVSAPVTSVTEATGAVASYTISLNAAQPAASSVSFALGNVGTATTADYGTAALTAVTGGATLAGSVITFPAGITTATITVPVTVDALTETGEGVSLTLSAPSTGATVSATAGTASVSIIDPPTPVFSLAASATAVGEGTPAVGTTAAVPAGTITLTVTRTGNTAGTDSVVVQATSGTGTNGAISGSDFVALSQTVSFAPTETTKTVTFTTMADSTREGDETLTVSLGTPSTGSSISTAAGASSVTLTITNDDPNLLPVITTPTTTPSAFIGGSTPVTGISFTDGDDNTGFSITVQAAGSSQVSFSALGTSVTAKNAANAAVYANETSNTIVLSGTKADLNTTLSNLKYTTNSTVPTSEQLVITITDSAGGVATKTLPINIGSSSTLTSSNDSFTGSAGDDEFSGSFANLATTDTINGGNGTDKLVLSAVDGSKAIAGAISNVEVLDLTLTGNSTVTVSSANFGSALTTVNATGNYTLGGTFNVGTTFNYASSTATNTLTITSLLTPSTSVASTGTTDAITVNLAGGVTLANITGGASVIDVLNINSNGTTANVVTTLGTLTADATINLGGAQQLTVALPNADYAVVNGTNATGKLVVDGSLVNTTAGTQFAIIGGSAGDALTGGLVATSISGGAGNDTIVGGAASDTITGGTGQDSLTGGATGVNTFVFAAGDSLATARDTITDLKEGDKIMFGTALTGLTNGATVGTTGTVHIDTTNSRLVVGTDEITIPTSVKDAAFTYSYGADLLVGTADDYITVGAAPFTATNNALGTLTLTGKAISTATVVLDSTTSAVAVNGAVIGSNAVNTINASTVTSSGVVITTTNTTSGTVRGLTITDSAQNDTFTLTTSTAGLNADTLNITGGTDTITNVAGATTTSDIIKVSSGATANATLIAGGTWAATSSTTNAGTLTVIAPDTVTSVDLSLVTTNTGTVTINASASTGTAQTLKGTGAGVTNITGGAVVDTITAAVGGGSITGGAGQDVITGGAGVDTVVFSTTFSAGNASADTISTFTINTDKYDVGFDVTNGTTTATSTLVAVVPVAQASNATATANDVIFTFAGAGDLLAAGTTAGTAVANAVTALTSGTDFSSANVATGDSFLLEMNDGTNTFLFHYVADATPATTAAADLELIGIINASTTAFATGGVI